MQPPKLSIILYQTFNQDFYSFKTKTIYNVGKWFNEMNFEYKKKV